jgi:hypothetical protein
LLLLQQLLQQLLPSLKLLLPRLLLLLLLLMQCCLANSVSISWLRSCILLLLLQLQWRPLQSPVVTSNMA